MELSSSTSLPGTAPSLPEGWQIYSRPFAGEGATAKRRGERGAANFKAIAWTVMLVFVIYIAAMVLPVMISEYEFQDSLQDIARYASLNRKSNESVKQSVFAEAQKEDLPVQAADIKVEGAAGNIHIDVDYSVTVDLKFYQWTINFHPSASNAALL
jgi:hypothetical protein